MSLNFLKFCGGRSRTCTERHVTSAHEIGYAKGLKEGWTNAKDFLESEYTHRDKMLELAQNTLARDRARFENERAAVFYEMLQGLNMGAKYER